MALIAGLEQVKSLIGEFSFCEFSTVRDLHFYEDLHENELMQMVELTVESPERSEDQCLRLRFVGVSGLTISEFGGAITQLIGLDVVDISEKGWEGIKWELLDYENLRIKCYANAVEVAVVSLREGK